VRPQWGEAGPRRHSSDEVDDLGVSTYGVTVKAALLAVAVQVPLPTAGRQ